MRERQLTDCVDIVGSSCKPFEGNRRYISTGAVATDHIDESDVEIVDYKSRPSRADLIVEPGTLLFAKMQGTKKTLYVDKEKAENIYSTGFFALKAKSGVISTRCLYHMLGSTSFLTQKDKNCSGATQKAITNAGLKKIRVSIPDYQLQEAIADQLDKISSVIQMRRSELQKLDDLVKARFVEMFGNPIENPMQWDTYSLKECLERIDNGKSFICSDKPRTGDNPAILKLSAATYGDYRSNENKALLDESLFVESSEVHAGDLLFTRKNTPELVGMAAYVLNTPPKLMMPDLIFRLVPNEKVNAVFLWLLINCKEFRPAIQAISGGSAKSMSNISKERLGKIKIICPPRESQDFLIPFVKQVDKSKFVESIHVLKLIKEAIAKEVSHDRIR